MSFDFRDLDIISWVLFNLVSTLNIMDKAKDIIKSNFK